MNTCPNWRLLLIDTLIIPVGFGIGGITVRSVKTRVAMPFMNELFQIVMIERLDCKDCSG